MLSGDSKLILQSLTTSKMRKKQTKKTVSFPQSKNLLELKLLVDVTCKSVTDIPDL